PCSHRPPSFSYLILNASCLLTTSPITSLIILTSPPPPPPTFIIIPWLNSSHPSTSCSKYHSCIGVSLPSPLPSSLLSSLPLPFPLLLSSPFLANSPIV